MLMTLGVQAQDIISGPARVIDADITVLPVTAPSGTWVQAKRCAL